MKKTLSLVLAVIMLLSCVSVSVFAAEEKASDYPFVLVHGMNGWGENTNSDLDYPYWGMYSGYDIANELRAKGLTVCVPTVGPLSSAWDRACELYAQLTGTVVDYGAAHSEEHGHDRYGRDYTGKGMLDGNWYESKINLVSHSFGGSTVRVFASLMAYGDEDEIKASPNDCSTLFTGGHNSVYSMTTLESPNNGSILANFMNDLYFPVTAYALLCNIEGMKDDPTTDYMLDQWGLTADPTTGETASFNIISAIKIAFSKDSAAYDMSLQGAKAINEKFRMDENVYYFSYSADMMDKDYYKSMLGNKASSMLLFTSAANYLLAGGIYGGVITDRSWAHNDGMVSVASAQYPEGEPHEDYTGENNITTGVWYVMPTATATHGYGMGGGNLDAFWTELINMLDAI